MSRASLSIRVFALLLVSSFGLSVWHQLENRPTAPDANHQTLRFAHWQLEPGVRRAFDAIVKDYEALHPGITVKQIAIPGNIYLQWGSTQLVGGSPPDLMQIGLGLSRGLYFKNFTPITTYVNEPNPYNGDNALANTSWRNTFRDGMVSSFDPKSMECIGASLFSGTTRMFCNLKLLQKITGSEEFPTRFSALQQLRDKLIQYNHDQATDISLIAGSKFSADIFFRSLFGSQTQRLTSRLNPLIDFPLTTEEFYLGYLEEQWTMQDEDIRRAALILKEGASMMSAGFSQAEGDQANFSFVQGHALLLVFTSLQATGIIEGTPFPVGIYRIPQPQPDNPVFGAPIRGPAADAPLNTYGPFGITRASPHKALALDFLRYLTSQSVSRKFAALSRNLPTIIGVEPNTVMKHFLPDLHGFPPGPGFYPTAEVQALFRQNQYLLAEPNRSADDFLAALAPEIKQAMRSDVERLVHSRDIGVSNLEAPILASLRLSQLHPDDPTRSEIFSNQIGTQNEIEAAAYYTRLRLAKSEGIGITPKP